MVVRSIAGAVLMCVSRRWSIHLFWFKQGDTKAKFATSDNGCPRIFMEGVGSSSRSPSLLSSKVGSDHSRRLSLIGEKFQVQNRLHFTVIGRSAWQVTEGIIQHAQDVFPALEPSRANKSERGGSLAVRKVDSLVSSASLFSASAGSDWLSCTVILESKGGDGTSSITSKCTTGNRPPKLGPGSPYFHSATPEWDSECAAPGSEAARLHYFPVETFREELPKITAVDQWRNHCVFFLHDPERGDDGDLGDLQRRLHEVASWSKSVAKMHAVKSLLPMFAVLLIHARSEAISPAGFFPNAFCQGPFSEEKLPLNAEKPHSASYVPIVDNMQKLFYLDGNEPAYYMCDFDDSDAVLKCVMHIAQSVIEQRAEVDMWATEAEADNEKQKQRGTRVCAIL